MEDAPLAPRQKASVFILVVLVCWLAVIGFVTIASAIAYYLTH